MAPRGSRHQHHHQHHQQQRPEPESLSGANDNDDDPSNTNPPPGSSPSGSRYPDTNSERPPLPTNTTVDGTDPDEHATTPAIASPGPRPAHTSRDHGQPGRPERSLSPGPSSRRQGAPQPATMDRDSAKGAGGVSSRTSQVDADADADADMDVKSAQQQPPSTLYRPKKSKRLQWLDAKDALFGNAGKAYQKIVVETILRQKPLPPSVDGRHIPLSASRKRADLLVDERSGKPYTSNFIRSSRYTVWDFLPKQLLFQFSKLGNAYFLSISIMQMIPGLSTTGQWTTFAPLMAFVALSMAKEGYDDYRRYMLDKADNRSEVSVLGEDLRLLSRAKDGVKDKAKKGRKNGRKSAHGHDSAAAELAMDDLGQAPPPATVKPAGGEEAWSAIQWQDVKVGDVVRLGRDESVPADIIILHATNPNSVAYIETMALDGETNLKARRASPLLAEACSTTRGLQSFEATVVSEDPNVDLYRYDGRVKVKEEMMPLSLTNVVYRGSTIRNTAETIGLVVNTGEECKIRMNAHKHVHTKAPAMQYVANRCIIWLVFVLLCLSGGLTAGYFLWRDPMESLAWYLADATLSVREILIAYIIMFNTLIPLSLYISLEIIKVIQFYLMGDVEMYDPVTNTPMVANTTTILEDLGQVNYVFSDKTGTLTENVMRFRKMSVAGTAWLHDMDVERDETAKQKLIELARKKRKGKNKQVQQVQQPEPGLRPGAESQPRASVSSVVRKPAKTAAEGGPELKTEELLDYIRRKPNTAFSKKAKHFLLSLALCHTCIPEVNSKGEIEYQAASPDEHALVEAARDLGYVLVDRPNQAITLQLPDPDGPGSVVKEKYEVLDVIDFTSKRKRMSIVVRMPDGRICVFCKGADTIILPRLKLSHLAMQKQNAVEEQARHKRSMEQEKQRMSIGSPRNSLAQGRVSMSKRHSQVGNKRSSYHEIAGAVPEDEDASEFHTPVESPTAFYSPLQAHFASPRASLALSAHEGAVDGFVDESAARNEGAVFERCFQHIDDFARDGLRTLLYGYRYMEEDEYAKWKKVFQDATTSIDNRQQKIEAAGELIEEGFDLAGATAIEDKLQEGVPETIDKLHRAKIKVWMLTGDKRETAINIAHSARLCKPYSEVYILDGAAGRLREDIQTTLTEVARGMAPHAVVVVDGATLGTINEDEEEDLAFLFYDLAGRVDSLICCRASPAQKANLVKRIRRQVPESLSLAIGDGANDIGMIQASHVGVGISGREGLQAARIADYSIAQFRFLQRLLFVHGRWNYLRTAKYILATFWKEIVFFLPQAHYQRFNGYSGTSLYENWSLTVFNTLFTSLPVIFLGGFEQDLGAETLLRYPELYHSMGHADGAINVWLYVGWTLMGIAESFIVYYVTWGVYERLPFDQDTSLYALGTVPFYVCVCFINIKLMYVGGGVSHIFASDKPLPPHLLTPDPRVLEMHNKTVIAFAGAFLSILGWNLWNLALSGVWQRQLGIYQISRAFLDNFGHTLNFWTVVLVALAAMIVLELLVSAVRRVYWANDVDLLQRIEKQERKEEKRRRLGQQGNGGEDKKKSGLAGLFSKLGGGKNRHGASGRDREESRAWGDGDGEAIVVEEQAVGSKGLDAASESVVQDSTHTVGGGKKYPGRDASAEYLRRAPSQNSRDEYGRRRSGSTPTVDGPEVVDPFEQGYGPTIKTGVSSQNIQTRLRRQQQQQQQQQRDETEETNTPKAKKKAKPLSIRAKWDDENRDEVPPSPIELRTPPPEAQGSSK